MTTAAFKSAAGSSLRLVGAWALLDLFFDLRYPGGGPLWRSLLPSLDATAILAIVAVLAARGRRAPRAFIVVAAIFATAVRLLRIGDGISERYFNRPMSLGLDLRLFMDLVRLLADTMSRAWLVLAGPLGLVALPALGLVAALALRQAERALAARAPRAIFAGGVALATVAGAFGGSALPRLAREAAFAARLDRYREVQTARIDATGRALAASPHGLDELGHAPVFIFLIESYGAVVLDQPDHARRMGPVYDAGNAALEAQGFAVASSLLDSPTYAGRSWLAHTTLTTGVRTTEVVTDRLIQARRPATLARFFHAAGYRTVLVQPANHYRELARWLYDFDVVYSGWDFGYRGPTYRWADMPDQYAIDFIHRHEVSQARAPLLTVYTLITSHAPWSDQPPIVADWSRIRDGAVYRTLPVARFPIGWTNLRDAGEAYDRSVAYDLEVIIDYVTRFLTRDALVLVLGDHQPVAEVTRGSPSSAVPIHVMSRNPAFVARFRARGYTPGLRPVRLAAPRGMETLLPDLLADFSSN